MHMITHLIEFMYCWSYPLFLTWTVFRAQLSLQRSINLCIFHKHMKNVWLKCLFYLSLSFFFFIYNAGRAQLSQRMMHMFPMGNAGDGFFINLCAVLLRLCRPFSQPSAKKLLDIQPTYCLATAGDREQVRARNVHMMGEYGRRSKSTLISCSLSLAL